jgi:succinyl-CoA synthetase beta subunit
VEARGIGVTYVKLDGSVGVIASGAGLGMATMDLLEEAGYKPANFLETGGGITEDLMYKSFQLVCKHEKVDSVIINLYGGVNPIEKGAKGIVRALQEMASPPVVVAKALGNKQEECWDVLKQGGVTVVTSVRTEAAVKSIIDLLENK